MASRLKVGASFIGWKALEAIVNIPESERDRLLILTIFKTGGRINEVLNLKIDNFDFTTSPNSVLVRDMPLSKSQPGATRGIFPVLLQEPLTDLWVKMLQRRYSDTPVHPSGSYLFQAWINNKPLNRVSTFYIQSKVGEKAGVKIGNHFWRGQRASQLAEEYDFDVLSLNQFFGWSRNTSNMAYRYASLGWRGLERRMIEGLGRLSSSQ